MLSPTTTTEPIGDAPRCDCCQHRVNVPGVAQIVCLAHLTVFGSAREAECGDFEPMARKASIPPAG